MKTTSLLLSIFIYLSMSYGSINKQKKGYVNGGIISLNNDTIAASIKKENILKLQSEVKFIDAGGKKKSFKPGVISGFFMDTENGRATFESRDDIQLSIFPSKNGNFVLRLSNNIYPLYYFVTTKMENTGIESEMKEVPHYLVLMGYRWYNYNEDSFETCTKLFSDDKALVKDIENGRYEFSDFPEIVERYCETIKAKHH
ncbi:hypothetical protein [uncultured Draconibacterium sp.]|uniref:hypothetical protein n=1 Tax=uncultured Draconibacterium sp. TaxID=1573823 RepID=UPI0029C6F93E|nr:hypothetical protein [uncultured Draconibacterium sp.]